MGGCRGVGGRGEQAEHRDAPGSEAALREVTRVARVTAHPSQPTGCEAQHTSLSVRTLGDDNESL